MIDPIVVLKTIAGDKSAPASARVLACKALLTAHQHSEGDDEREDPVARRALRILNGGKP
jgi:hypothetical protein